MQLSAPRPPLSLGHLLCLVVVLLPLCSLVQLYLRLVALLLLYLAHQAAW